MKLASAAKLGQKGFAHQFLLPVLAIAAVAVIGGVVTVAINHAQTLPCTSQTFQSGSSDSKDGTHCVQYIQQMLNGLGYYAEPNAKKLSIAEINSAPLNALASNFGNGSFGNTSDVYDSNTVTVVATVQKWMNGSNSLPFTPAEGFKMTQATFNSRFLPHGALPTSGVTETKTWYALCQSMNQIPSSYTTVNNTTDYTSGKPNSAGTNKTNTWYLRSYLRAGITAASNAGCKAVLSGSSSSVPTAPTGVKATTANSKLTVSWNAVGNTKYYEVAPLNLSGAVIQAGVHDITPPTTVVGYSVATVGGSGNVEVRDCNESGICSGWTKVGFNFAK
jgi:hypothetical protein